MGKDDYWHAKLLDGAVRVPLFRDWKAEDQMIYVEGIDHVDLPFNGALCLVGCNGIGKTTTLEEIRQALVGIGFRDASNEREYNPLSGLDDLLGNERSKAAGYIVSFDKGTRFVRADSSLGSYATDYDYEEISSWVSSHGEGIIARLNGAVRAIAAFVKKAKAEKVPLVVTIDDADAGTSIDVVAELRAMVDDLVGLLTSDGVPHLILISSNSFELVRGLPCLYVRDMTPRRFDDYDSYREFVLESKKDKTARNKARAALLEKKERKRKERAGNDDLF